MSKQQNWLWREQQVWAGFNLCILSQQLGMPTARRASIQRTVMRIMFIRWFHCIVWLCLRCNFRILPYHFSKSKSQVMSNIFRQVNLVLNIKPSSYVIWKRTWSESIWLWYSEKSAVEIQLLSQISSLLQRLMILCRHVWRMLVYAEALLKGSWDHIVDTVRVSTHLNKITALRDCKMFPGVSTALANLLGLTAYEWFRLKSFFHELDFCWVEIGFYGSSNVINDSPWLKNTRRQCL